MAVIQEQQAAWLANIAGRVGFRGMVIGTGHDHKGEASVTILHTVEDVASSETIAAVYFLLSDLLAAWPPEAVETATYNAVYVATQSLLSTFKTPPATEELDA